MVIVILRGPSGSGKSTFMKMITQRIQIDKNCEIPSTSRLAYYDEKLKLGTMSIFEEMFCCEENPNLDKMQSMLENLHLWTEIKKSANAEEILEYIIKFCNMDKKRTIIIATHQNLQGLSKLKPVNLRFAELNGKNTIFKENET